MSSTRIIPTYLIIKTLKINFREKLKAVREDASLERNKNKQVCKQICKEKDSKTYLPTSKEISAIESYTHEIVFKWAGIKDSFFQIKGKKRKNKLITSKHSS